MNNDFGVRKKVNGMLISVIAVSVLAVIFLILFVIQVNQNNKLKDEVARLKTDIALFEAKNEEIEKKTLKENSTKKTVEIEHQGLATKETGTVSVKDSKKYLEPKGWDVKFEYPAGVTDIAYGLNEENYDGSLYITGIAVGSKIYDASICGGLEAYQQYPFFLGELNRWNPSGAHDEWENSPSVYDGMKRFLKTASFEYYINTFYGNGCETGENEDYKTATQLAKQILESITSK